MYDRQTESLWSHFDATGIVVVEAGTELEVVPVQKVAFEDFREAHPDGRVLSRDIGHDRDYGANPYVSYDAEDGTPFAFDGDADGRMPGLLIAGLRSADFAAKAV